MIILNFTHPLTENDVNKIQEITGKEVTKILDISSQIDTDKDLEPQLAVMLEDTGLSSKEWQTTPLIVNLPSLSYSAAVLLSMFHGLTGYFPPVLRLSPLKGALPPLFEVAEILNLQEIRSKFREKRKI